MGVLLALPTDATANCNCAPMVLGGLQFSCYKIEVTGTSAQKSTVQAGAGTWQSKCNAGRLAVPHMQVFDPRTDPEPCANFPPSQVLEITVRFLASQPDNGRPPECGLNTLSPGNNTSTLDVYARSKDGGSCGNRPQDTVAHELGHNLGFGDILPTQECTICCAGRVMSGNHVVNTPSGQVTIPRLVTDQDCQRADQMNNPQPPQPPPPEAPLPGSDPQPSPQDQCPNCGSPIVIDLAGDGFRFTGPRRGVSFDIDADGEAERLTWTDPRGDEAFLVLDRNGNGAIDDGGELFGNATPQPPSDDPNGFRALAVFDRPAEGGDGDGRITAADAVWPRLQLWRDGNHDAIAQPWELSSPGQHGITAFHLRYITSRRTDRHGNRLRWASWVEWGGRRRLAAIDVIFQSAE
jgi:hypothetical protein